MKDWIARPIRTFGQAFVGAFVLFYLGPLQNLMDNIVRGGEVDIDLNFWRNGLLACSIAGVISLVSFAQNLLEAKTPMPTVLKPASPPAPSTVETVQT
jgi:hypothetical protein